MGDIAVLYGTAGDDTFFGRDDYGYLTDSDANEYKLYVKLFDLVYADAGDDDDDNDTLDYLDLDYNLITQRTW